MSPHSIPLDIYQSPVSAVWPISYPVLSFCSLQDRVIINRIDSICHTILKGKWPSSSQQYESPTSLANTCVPNSAHQRAGFLPTRMPISQGLNFNLSHTVSHLPKVGVRSHHQTGWWCLQILKKLWNVINWNQVLEISWEKIILMKKKTRYQSIFKVWFRGLKVMDINEILKYLVSKLWFV